MRQIETAGEYDDAVRLSRVETWKRKGMGEDRLVAPVLCLLQFFSAMYIVLERRRAFGTAESIGCAICVRGCGALGC
jgi:hypothetical protein